MAAHLFIDKTGHLIAKAPSLLAPRVFVATNASTARQWEAMLRRGEIPRADGYPVSMEGLEVLSHNPRSPSKERAEFARCATDFANFVNVWQFKSLETGKVLVMGEHLWQSQETFIRTVSTHKHCYFLKARKLSISTTECAFDAWAARFGPAGRVHLLSRYEKAARDLLRQVEFGLERLPKYMRVPSDRQASTVTLLPNTDDSRTLQAYSTSKDTAREASALHSHVDELAAMLDPASTWQAIEPTFAPGGSSHVLTTGNGPEGFAADLWRRAEAEEAGRFACFIPADQRPDRTPEVLEQLSKTMDSLHFKREYPMLPEDALAAGGAYVFRGDDLDRCEQLALGFRPFEKGHRYAIGCDIGTVDATVLTVIDCTTDELDVVGWRYLKGIDTGTIQWNIERIAEDWPTAHVMIEDNSLGVAIRENLNIRGADHRVSGFTTTGQSKPRIIDALRLAVEQQRIYWNPRETPQLAREMRSYQYEDKNIRQDTIMSLALSLEACSRARNDSAGRILRVSKF
jgi:hypothetical protein